MPYDNEKRRNLAEGTAALRQGGRRLSEITGEDEPMAAPPRNVLAEGFRRLTGVEKPVRRYGGTE